MGAAHPSRRCAVASPGRAAVAAATRRTGRMEQLIRKDMPVLGSDGGHVGTVDALVPGGRIRLTREDDPAHNHGYRHLPLHLVARVEAGQVRLTVPAQDAKAI